MASTIEINDITVQAESHEYEPQSHQPLCKLYVGNLDARVDEPYLHQLFLMDLRSDLIESVKIVPQPGGLNYGFVEYKEPEHAETAIQLLNGKRVFTSDIRVNWAFAGSSSKEDLSTHSHIFVGDLGSEVNDQLLAKAFSAFGSLSDARVMWDPNSGKSRGYGFVAFKDREDAERAISAMNNEWLGSRPIRVNWANQKSQNPALARQDSQSRNELDIAPLFSQFGFIRELRLQSEKGFGFVKLDTHENAAMAIFSLNGYSLHGRQLKCSWGKERIPDMNNQVGGPAGIMVGMNGNVMGAYDTNIQGPYGASTRQQFWDGQQQYY
ncbi:hypothetical protein HK100_003353 [Physocladia obscura]|uniref:RRM domain-containing protein n=1 Tax=Physocladia obscura TaxID=109957 RepID=A0AAD5T7J3_9FUNG|nr:hypothetical protein HK100_003353 [Physocladia obscura]